MKRFGLLAVTMLALIAFAVPSISATKAPAELIKMQVPEGAKAKKPTVNFPHIPHEHLDCTHCHHTWDQKSDVKKCKDSGCHDNTKTKKGDTSYYLAYHKKGDKSCLGCHKELKKAKAEKMGPSSCNGCHVKKK